MIDINIEQYILSHPYHGVPTPCLVSAAKNSLGQLIALDNQGRFWGYMANEGRNYWLLLPDYWLLLPGTGNGFFVGVLK